MTKMTRLDVFAAFFVLFEDASEREKEKEKRGNCFSPFFFFCSESLFRFFFLFSFDDFFSFFCVSPSFTRPPLPFDEKL